MGLDGILTFWEQGTRRQFEGPYRERRYRSIALAAAWCATRDDRYLDRLGAYLFAICEESSWVYPAHYKNIGADRLPSPLWSYIDLGSAMSSTVLSEIRTLLLTALDLELVERLRWELERRILIPFLRHRGMHWMHTPGNWNSVCNCGVLHAALHTVASDRLRTRIVRCVMRSLEHYRDGFAEDGGTAEGSGYWCYGFARYCASSELIERATCGRLSLFRGIDKVHRMAQFPAAIHLGGERFINFADANETVRIPPFVKTYLWREHAIPLPLPLSEPTRIPEFDFDLLLRDLAAETAMPPPADPARPPEVCVFDSLGWYILRDAAGGRTLTVAAKGGNNEELHNHNDLGSFIVAWGEEAYIAELGKDAYRKEHFGPDRYTILSCSSEGHSVPIVDGHLQGTGRRYTAGASYRRVLDPEGSDVDEIAIDLSRAYPSDAGVRVLTRRLALVRADRPAATLTDTVQLRRAGRFEEVFWTFSEPSHDGSAIVVPGRSGMLRVTAAGDIDNTTIERRKHAVDPGVPRDAFRILYTTRRVVDAVFRFRFAVTETNGA